MNRKVLAYITKDEGAERKILVFKHKNKPEAGIQVPGGTIESDELPIDALYREIEEETGLKREFFSLVGHVKNTNYSPPHKDIIYERTFFHLSYIGTDITEWEHHVEGEGQDKDMIFCLYWVPLVALPELAALQDQAIELIVE